MANIINFETDFGIHIDNVVPKIMGTHTREEQTFADLTYPLIVVLGAAKRVIERGGKDYFSLKFDHTPARDAHHILYFTITLRGLVETHEFRVFWVGGNADVTISGFEDFAQHLQNVKGYHHNAQNHTVQFAFDADPNDLAEGFADVLYDFYKV
ncbi:hypothetical protein [Neorhizobium sp. NCHU2750]|uniref:hypothetical protein n=1 Tax=Neorhizobium sp. NCHU2750 TaxID=1825976 RepID=UPI000E741AD5|nr:hypothetical protein NCHU2750_23670 [Neorhizobium sp. NCHU2750]